MTPTKTADMIAREMLEELADLERRMMIFGERYDQYGRQFESSLSPEMRAELDAAWQGFAERMKAAGADL